MWLCSGLGHIMNLSNTQSVSLPVVFHFFMTAPLHYSCASPMALSSGALNLRVMSQTVQTICVLSCSHWDTFYPVAALVFLFVFVLAWLKRSMCIFLSTRDVNMWSRYLFHPFTWKLSLLLLGGEERGRRGQGCLLKRLVLTFSCRHPSSHVRWRRVLSLIGCRQTPPRVATPQGFFDLLSVLGRWSLRGQTCQRWKNICLTASNQFIVSPVEPSKFF